MRRLLLPLLLLFVFILESIFVELLPAELFHSNRILVPHFLMIFLLFLTIYGNEKHGYVYSFIFGLLFDVVYTEVIGIYLCIYPLIAYICTKLMKILQTNLVMVSSVIMLGVVLLEFGVYGIVFLLHRTDLVITNFIQIRLFPTFILNIAFLIIVAVPLKRFFDKYASELRND
ncbi:rod shape-determining protein MreD [Bacillus sp. 03113]|uniref:rod shape-determining protein MreD n=1 Tax=Bacillus sp. 03113 TaxID=2578211 RepID=UPI00114240B7|nr:rod shape-determining protein MreD [Bacillus sp. 03113]